MELGAYSRETIFRSKERKVQPRTLRKFFASDVPCKCPVPFEIEAHPSIDSEGLVESKILDKADPLVPLVERASEQDYCRHEGYLAADMGADRDTPIAAGLHCACVMLMSGTLSSPLYEIP